MDDRVLPARGGAAPADIPQAGGDLGRRAL